jgi:hypothetical protein
MVNLYGIAHLEGIGAEKISFKLIGYKVDSFGSE